MLRITRALSVMMAIVGMPVMAASCGGIAGFGTGTKSAEAYFDVEVEVELADGIRKGDLDTIRRAIHAGASVNAVGREGMTPVFWALVQKEPEALELLLQKGADPNTVTQWVASGETRTARAIELAIYMPDTRYLSLLLRYGGDPNTSVDEYGSTVVHSAAQAGALDSLRLLVEAGADVNRRGAAGITPVLEAVLVSRFVIANYLVRSGADPGIVADKGFTAARIVSLSGIRGISPDSPDVPAYEEFRAELRKRGLLED